MWCKTSIYNCCLLCKNYRGTKFNQPSQISHTYCLPNKSPILILLILFLLLQCLAKIFGLQMLLTIDACYVFKSGLSSGAQELKPGQNKKGQKIFQLPTFRCFFFAASCRKRHRKVGSWKIYRPFLFWNDFR